jgi:hypothetical protein
LPHLRQQGGELPGNWAIGAGAQQRIHEDAGRLQPVAQGEKVRVILGAGGRDAKRRQSGVVLFVIVRGVGRTFPQIDVYCRARFMQITGADQTVAAVVARPGQHQTGDPAVARQDRFGDAAPGKLHHGGKRMPRRVGAPLDCLHLGDGHNPAGNVPAHHATLRDTIKKRSS